MASDAFKLIGQGSEWFWALLQFAVVAATLLLIYRQIRVQTASHVVATLNGINARWNADAMLRARHACCSQWLAGHREFDPVADFLGEFMEELGTYFRLRALPVDILWGAQSWYIENYYSMLRDGMQQHRDEYKDDTLHSEFQALFNAMSTYSKSQGASASEKSDDDLRKFAESEVKVAEAFLRLKAAREA